MFDFESMAFLIQLFTSLISMAVSVAMLILYIISVYTIANKFQIKAKGWACFPPTTNFIFGEIADTYNAKAGKKTNYGITLLITMIASCLVSVILSFIAVYFLIKVDYSTMYSVSSVLGIMIFLSLFFIAVAIVVRIFTLLSFNTILKAYDPKNRVLIVVASIFLPIIMNIYLFILRNREPVLPTGAWQNYGGATAPQQPYFSNGQNAQMPYYQQNTGYQPPPYCQPQSQQVNFPLQYGQGNLPQNNGQASSGQGVSLEKNEPTYPPNENGGNYQPPQ